MFRELLIARREIDERFRAHAQLRSDALNAVIVDGKEVLIKQQPVGGTASSTAMLATVRPTQLLTGKVIGFAALAFSQMLALGVTFAICGVAVGRTRSDRRRERRAGDRIRSALRDRHHRHRPGRRTRLPALRDANGRASQAA